MKLALGAAGAALAADSLLWEPYHPQVTRIETELRNLPEAFDGFTIAQLSDFHYEPYFGAAQIRAGVEVANRLSPDLVVLTGDFVTVPFVKSRGRRRRAAAMAEPCAELLASLKARCGSYAVLGNHDVSSDADMVTEALEQRGIPVLSNRAVPITQQGARFWLAGVNDVMERRADLDTAMRDVDRREPVVLLAHEPDFADLAALHNVDLQLSGHSHGGQIRLPFLVPAYLPPLARKYPWGIRRIGGLILYTNAGVGTIHVPMRWNCPAEVTLIILRKGGQQQGERSRPPSIQIG